MIAITHAYSRHNSGDGLLVDLTLDRLARHGVSSSDCVVFAMDPTSFPELPHVEKFGTAGRSANAELVGATVRALGVVPTWLDPRLGVGRSGRLLAGAELYVAVGGGYLRAGSRTNALGTLVNHLPQLLCASRSSKPSLYLPQSIGPLDGRVGRMVCRGLGRVSAVHVRDDTSEAALSSLDNVTRTADLAVLRLAENAPSPRPSDGPAVLIARDLPGTGEDYRRRLLRLAELLEDPVWAVQAEGAAEKSDRTFYDTLGVEPHGLAMDVLDADPAGPVVSVRLHGALEAMLAGRAVVHLGYERKSWGAFEDLGLTEWVHPARTFDPAVVAQQVAELRRDPSRFWDAVHRRVPTLVAQSENLDRSVAAGLRSAGF